MPVRLPRVHCLTPDPADTDRRHVLDLLEAVTIAGVDGVQVRAKSLDTRELLRFTRQVLDRVKPYGATVIVNDRVDVALAAGADGVHLGRDDLPVADARRLAPGLLVGATCRNPEHAQQAVADGADYAGVGPVYRSTSKTELPPPIGLDTLRDTAAVIPAVAIAGITPARVPEVMETGAYGIAVAAALGRADDPAHAAADLMAAVDAHRRPATTPKEPVRLGG